MRVQVLALDDVFDLGLAAVLDALQTANELAPAAGLDAPPFDVQVVGMRRRVRSAQGFAVPVVTPGRRRPDVLVVPALGFKMPGPLVQALNRRDVADAASFIAAAGRAGARLCAACIGTFVLAESGALDGHAATTTWWLAPLFRQRYPAVQLEASRMVVPSGRVVTAGAALSHMDLALWLVRSVSPDLATLTARYLVVDARPSQAAYAMSDHLAHSDPLVERFERWARRHLAERFSLDAAARASGTSTRTLARRLALVLGRSPLAYVQDLRVERAVHLLRTTAQNVDTVAAAVGYADGVTLRTLLRRRQLGVRALRQGSR
ncbi:MAG: helix-turn-helix domain-containing protein [Vicinamibacterales bacterium]